jgi:hypothetical protein
VRIVPQPTLKIGNVFLKRVEFDVLV